jgi:hypothetical protein
MIEISDGFTDIAIGSDVLNAQPRDPLTSTRMATGARVTLRFLRREALPVRAMVSLRYDLAENGGEREVQGVPQVTHTVKEGEQVIHHYRLAYWLAPHAIMKFAPPLVRQRAKAAHLASPRLHKASLAG